MTATRPRLPIRLEAVPEDDTTYTESVRCIALASSLLLRIERRRLEKEAAQQGERPPAGKRAP